MEHYGTPNHIHNTMVKMIYSLLGQIVPLWSIDIQLCNIVPLELFL